MALETEVFNSNLIHLISQASIPAKLVLAVLLVFSVASWAIIYNKFRAFRTAERQNGEFLRLYRQSARFGDAYPHCPHYPESPMVKVFSAAFGEWYGPANDRRVEEEPADPPTSIMLDRVMRRAAMTEIERMERGLSWLASIATSAPFIGLFGTVVGIIIAFQGLSSQTQTSVQSVAPGIAEALVATAAGLFVAVPAYMAYNHFVAQVRRLVSQLDDFCLETMNAIDRNMRPYGVFKP